MGSKDQFMLELVASLGDKHSMAMMLPSRRNPQARHAIVCLNGVAAVLDPERKIRKGNQRTTRRRQRVGRCQHKYMHSKILRKELKVSRRFNGEILFSNLYMFLVKVSLMSGHV